MTKSLKGTGNCPSCKSAFAGLSYPEIEKILYSNVMMGLSAQDLEDQGIDLAEGPPILEFHPAPYGM